MVWELCIQYANGSEKALRRYQNREKALRCVDRLYSKHGYPMHMAFVVRPGMMA
jgi:hypothetical protein